MKLFRTKPIEPEATGLRRCLSAFDLILLGIGAIIGAGIFVLTGIAAATQAGPSIVLSYVIAAIACSFAALSYAELAASIGGAGSAYSYAYAGLGEMVAWIIGWALILEYGIAVCAVAIGWSGYANDALLSIGLHIPSNLLKPPAEGGIFNLPAMTIIMLLSGILMLGVKQSARFNRLIVFTKIAAISVFVLVAIQHVNPVHWKPFMPFGWAGTVEGAALVFFAFIGADKANYLNYYKAVLPKVKSGGLIIFDNSLLAQRVLNPQDPDSQAIDETNKYILSDASVENVLLTVRDGVNIVRKR